METDRAVAFASTFRSSKKKKKKIAERKNRRTERADWFHGAFIRTRDWWSISAYNHNTYLAANVERLWPIAATDKILAAIGIAYVVVRTMASACETRESLRKRLIKRLERDQFTCELAIVFLANVERENMALNESRWREKRRKKEKEEIERSTEKLRWLHAFTLAIYPVGKQS